MAKRALFLLLFGSLGCDPNVVDAVREPPMPIPTPGNPLESSLIHRYSFDGKGREVLDSKGAAHGQLQGTLLQGTGQLLLAGERTGQYVNLPNGIVSGLVDATFEAWLTWSGGEAWQRIFDFGNNNEGEDAAGDTGTSYLYLTPASWKDPASTLPATLHLAYSQAGKSDEDLCDGPGSFPTGVETHVAVVIVRATQRMALYQDGVLLADCFLGRPLSAIDDVNNWLAHSNFSADVDLSGMYDEFRIYDAALTASELATSFKAGPNAGR
jgi:Concanavalin A-like lectin/glucanases superfamily